MKSIDRGRGYELFTPDECRAIEAVICRHLGTWTNDKESVRETLRLLNEAGLDPWAPISGVQES